MTKRKSRLESPWPRGVTLGKQYRGVHGKVIDWVEHAFEEGALYLHVRFTDKTELSWRIVASVVLEEADLSDWKTGNFRPLAVFSKREVDTKR